MPTKVSMIFQFRSAPVDGSGQLARVAGWSESHWRTVNDVTPAIYNALAGFRTLLLPTAASLTALRVTQYGTTSGRLVQQGVQVIALDGHFGNSGLLCDIPNMGLLINSKATGTVNTANWDFRAVPDARVVGGEYAPGNPYTQNVANYLSYLDANAWGWVGVDLTKPKVRVISLAANVLTVGSGSGIAANTWVRLYRVTTDGGVKLNGTYYVSSVIGDALTLVGLPTGAAITKPNGTARWYVPIFLDYAGSSVVRIRTHKVGRIFSQYRGRQRRA
jgi:hypothetical protein